MISALIIVMESVLYVGDVPDSTTAPELVAFFTGFPIGQPVLHKNNKNETYAIIQVENKSVAQAIIERFNYTTFKNREIRICNFVPKLKREIEGNLYFKAPREMAMRNLFTILRKYGEILNLKLSLLPDGGSRGYGYVQYAKKEEASKAIEDVHHLFRKKH